MPKQGQYSDAHLEGFILDTNAQDGITNAQINRRRPKLVALGNTPVRNAVLPTAK